jgi:hypothetical protein
MGIQPDTQTDITVGSILWPVDGLLNAIMSHSVEFHGRFTTAHGIQPVIAFNRDIGLRYAMAC